MEGWQDCSGFEWDEGNADKNWNKHRVSRSECEQVFFNLPLVVREDPAHSHTEERFWALGQTDTGRRLFVVYTLRGELIRVISARDMTPRERRAYERERKDDLKPIPKFESEDEEREFWATHDATDYIDWSQGRRVSMPNLKPSTKTISLRLPEPLLEDLKMLAHKRDVPYQSLLKVFLAERVEQELRARRAS